MTFKHALPDFKVLIYFQYVKRTEQTHRLDCAILEHFIIIIIIIRHYDADKVTQTLWRRYDTDIMTPTLWHRY